MARKPQQKASELNLKQILDDVVPAMTDRRSAAAALGITEDELVAIEEFDDFPRSSAGYDLPAIRAWVEANGTDDGIPPEARSPKPQASTEEVAPPTPHELAALALGISPEQLSIYLKTKGCPNCGDGQYDVEALRAFIEVVNWQPKFQTRKLRVELCDPRPRTSYETMLGRIDLTLEEGPLRVAFRKYVSGLVESGAKLSTGVRNGVPVTSANDAIRYFIEQLVDESCYPQPKKAA